MLNDLLDTYLQRYLTKKELLYRLPSKNDIEEFWLQLINYRKEKGIELNLIDQKKEPLWFVINKQLEDALQKIDDIKETDLFNYVPEEIGNAVITDVLIDEAFNSSVIEGAFSTKKRTREIVEKKAIPSNKSEQMIINNYEALEFILENLNRPFDEDMILTIYRILTKNTLDTDDIVEKYRNDSVYVMDLSSQETIYEAPPHTDVQLLMDSLIEFVNTEDVIHPVIKSCIIHFYFVYIHPFFDGNGRTARAISYMYLLQKGYDIFKFFSISSVIKEEKSKYYKAIKDVEDYGSDITYFINYYTLMILKSIVNVIEKFQHEYGSKRIKIIFETVGIILSKRQNKAVNFYIKSHKNFTTTEEYMKKFKVAYETARTDLNQLEALGFFVKSKAGKKFIYKILDINETINNIKNKLELPKTL